MAKLKAFSCFDSKLGSWNPPMFLQHAGQAERMFEELVNDPQNIICKHPTDFSLFMVGDFDDQSGVLTPLIPPVQLQTALGARRKPHPELPLAPSR